MIAEALEIMHRSVDRGYILESCHSQTHEITCSCHGTTCGHIKIYTAFSPEDLAQSNVMPHMSHFSLVHDRDACIQCGTCVGRCPVGAISMGEDGYPQVSSYCFRCGHIFTNGIFFF